VIADQRRAQHTVRAIAAELGRSPSTISRELRRNRDVATGHYRPFTAHKLAGARRARPKVRKLTNDGVLRSYVQDRLEKRWSPEQICQTLRVQFRETPGRHLVHETVYQALYVGDGTLHRDLCGALRTGRRRRKPRRRSDARRPNGFIDPTTRIDRRPAEAADRSVVGHWEGDLLMGAGNRSAIVSNRTVCQLQPCVPNRGDCPERRDDRRPRGDFGGCADDSLRDPKEMEGSRKRGWRRFCSLTPVMADSSAASSSRPWAAEPELKALRGR
jgi:hypothetical protein